MSCKLDEFKDVLHKWLYVEDDTYVDVVFGAVFSGRLDCDPLWMHIVGAPGIGKTEIIQAMDGHASIFPISTLTSHTLVSGIVPEPGQPDPSLLPKLRGKILCIKDFTAIMKMRNEDVQTICGQLRDVYDGVLRAHFGTGKEAVYKVKFGIITGVTSEIYHHEKMMSALGARFLIYEMPKPRVGKEPGIGDEIEKRVMCALNTHESKKMRSEEMKRAAHRVLAIRQRPVSITHKQLVVLKEASLFAAYGRTYIKRDKWNAGVLEPFDPEIPTRVAKQLESLAKGICMAREMRVVDDYVMGLCVKTATDTMSNRRKVPLTLLRGWEGKKVRPTIAMLAKQIGYANPTVTRWMDDLVILGLVDKIAQGKNGKGPKVYSVKKRWLNLLSQM